MNDPRALARTNDPDTSHEAAAEVEKTGKAASQRAAVLTQVWKTPGCTAAEIASAACLERHVPSRRLPELRDAGFVETGPARECRIQGTRSLTWNIAKQPELFR